MKMMVMMIEDGEWESCRWMMGPGAPKEKEPWCSAARHKKKGPRARHEKRRRGHRTTAPARPSKSAQDGRCSTLGQVDYVEAGRLRGRGRNGSVRLQRRRAAARLRRPERFRATPLHATATATVHDVDQKRSVTSIQQTALDGKLHTLVVAEEETLLRTRDGGLGKTGPGFGG